jgi:hypothetical protein
MERSQIPFEQHMFMIGARDISRATRARTAAVQSVMHGMQHIRVLTHPEVIIGTPNRHLPPHTLIVPRRAREFTTAPFQIGENAIPAFATQAIKLTLEEFFVIHVTLSSPRMTFQVLRLREGRFRPVLPKQGHSPCLG